MKKTFYSLLCLGLLAATATAQVTPPCGGNGTLVNGFPEGSTADAPVWYTIMTSHLSETDRQNRFVYDNGGTYPLTEKYADGFNSNDVANPEYYAWRLQDDGSGNYYLVSKNGERRINVVSTVANTALTMVSDGGATWALALTRTISLDQTAEYQWCFNYTGTSSNAYLNAMPGGNTPAWGLTTYSGGLHQASGWFFYTYVEPTPGAATDAKAEYADGTVSLSWTNPTVSASGTANLTTAMSIDVMQGTSVLHTLTGCVPGEAGSYAIEGASLTETTTYTIVAYYDAALPGTAAGAIATIEAPETPATPAAVAGFTATAGDEGVALAFTMPTLDTEGNALDGTVYYVITRGETVIVEATASTPGATVTYTDTEELAAGEVTYGVYTYVDALYPSTTATATATISGGTTTTKEEVIYEFGTISTAAEEWTNNGEITAYPQWYWNWINANTCWGTSYSTNYPGTNHWLYSVFTVPMKAANKYKIEYTLSRGNCIFDTYIATESLTTVQSNGISVGSVVAPGLGTFATEEITVDADGDYYIGFYAHDVTVMTYITNIKVYEISEVSSSVSGIKAAGKVYSYGSTLVVPADVEMVSVYDLQGRRVMATRANGEISLQGLNRGIYVVKATKADGSAITTKIRK